MERPSTFHLQRNNILQFIIKRQPALQEKKTKCILEKDEPLSTFLKDLKYIAKIETVPDSKGEVLYFK